MTNLYELVHEAAKGPTVTWHPDVPRDDTADAMNLRLLVNYLRFLGDGELMVLSFIAERLEEGRRLHGDLDILGDRRDWAVELGEEAADALVYAAALRLRELATGRGQPVPIGVIRCEGDASHGPATRETADEVMLCEECWTALQSEARSHLSVIRTEDGE